MPSLIHRLTLCLLVGSTISDAHLAERARGPRPGAETKTIAVIGAGFSGLTASLELRHLGYNVVVLDKLPQPGGRAQREHKRVAKDEYAFDTGPSWYWMPEIFDDVLARFGQKRSDHYNITRLDPAYRLVFGVGSEDKVGRDNNRPVAADVLDVPGTREGFLAMASSMDPSANISAFFADAAVKYDVGTRRAIWEVPAWPLPKWLLSPGLSASLITQTLAEHIAGYTSHSRLRAVLEWPSQFLGMDASTSPSLYSLITYAGHALGTWMPLGPHGMQAPAMALYHTGRAMGVEYHLSTEITRLESEGRRRITKIHAANGRSWKVDGVVAAADYHHVEQKLLPPELRRHAESYWTKQVMTPSTVIFKLCVAAPVPTLPTTHSLWFDDMTLPFYATSDAYMKEVAVSTDMQVASARSKRASSSAPNSTSVFVLVPMMTSEAQKTPRKDILSRILKRLQIDLRTVVCGSKGYGPLEYTRDYHAFRGNAFGHANLLSQSMWLKPAMDSLAENLVYAGHLTHPGPGVPPAMVSGILAANHLDEQLAGGSVIPAAAVLLLLVCCTVLVKSKWVSNARALHKGGRTYFAAASAMPMGAFNRIAALYAAFREADDLVDCTHVDADTRLQDLNDFEEQVLSSKASRQGYPAGLWKRFFAAMRSDCDPNGITCHTMGDLVAYMGGSAAVLGEFMLPVLLDAEPEDVLGATFINNGVSKYLSPVVAPPSPGRSVSSASSTSIEPSDSSTEEEVNLTKAGAVHPVAATVNTNANHSLLAPARALGYAFQLTNMLRDVVEDGRLKRQYIPAEVCARHGLTGDLCTAALTPTDPRFRAVMEEMFEVADHWYAHADKGIALLPDSTRAPIALARTSYHRLHDGIRAAGYRLETRVVVPWRLKLADAIALLSWRGVGRMILAELLLSAAAFIADWGVCVAGVLATWVTCQVVDVSGVITYGQFHKMWTLPLLAGLMTALWYFKLRNSEMKHTDLLLACCWTGVLCVVAFVYTTPWDSFLIYKGVWASSADQVSGSFLQIPYEEYAFFVLATLITCCAWMLTWPKRWNDVELQARPSKLIAAALVACMAVGVVCVVFADRTFYMGALLLWSVPVLLLQWLVGGHVIAAHKGPFVRIVLLSGLAMAIMDHWAIQRNIWVLNPEFSLWPWARGLHPEEVLFFLLSSAMCAGGLTLAMWVSKGFLPFLVPPRVQEVLQLRK